MAGLILRRTKGLLFLAVAVMDMLLSPASQAVTEKPLYLNFNGGIEVLEIRGTEKISVYRAVVNGQVVDEGKFKVAGGSKLFVHVDWSRRYETLFNFDHAAYGHLRPDFPGIENQCSHSTLNLPPSQTLAPSTGWTSIYRLTISDPCQKKESTLDIQIR